MCDNILSAGLAYVYLCGREEDGYLYLDTVDSYRHIEDGFYRRIMEQASGGDDDGNRVRIFAVLGAKRKVERVFKLVCDGVTDNFQRIAAGQVIRKVRPELDRTGNAFFRSVQEFFCEQMDHYPKRYAADFGAFMLGGIWCSPMPDGMAEHFVEKVLSLWLKREEPYLAGQQLMLRSFFMRDFVGRKVIACLPQLQTNLWSLVFEGGHQLVLDAEMSYTKEAVSHDDLGAFSSSNIQSILFDPIHAYGTHFLPSDLSEEWHKVFLYLCAIARTEWTVDELAEVYEKFLSFLRENICDTIPGPTGITKELYHSAQLRLIRDVRSFLRGEDEQVTSKDLHQTLNSRYVYLPHLWGLFPHEEEQGEFSAQTFRGLIEKALHADGSYEKGVLWEDAAAYLLERIGGWRITGRRIKAGAQEIDISVANVSLDDELWQLGAYILIECKNWSDRVDLHQIRNIAHISNMKGNKTALLFAANGITGDAEKEILRLAAENLSIISLDAAELRLLKSAADCRKLILDKWRELGDSVDVGSVI